MSNSRLALIVGGLLGLCGLTGCRPAEAVRPNVILIVVDTLRQDHVGCHGHDRDTTPSIDAFASGAIRFDRAYATAPWTKPSVASMFTGLYPSRHGVRELKSALPDELVTLAEILGGEGYATAGVVSHILLNRSHGFAQGFGEYVSVNDGPRPHESVTTGPATDAAVEILHRLEQGADPFFLFVHYFDPHYNYMRHPEYGFAPESAGRLDGDETIYDLYEVIPDMTAEEIEFVKALYDEEIRHTDAGIGRLLDTVEQTGLLDDTLIILISDHGEEFMAHGNIGHTVTLYEELMLVPLILRPPGTGVAPRTVDNPVTIVSVTPTVLDLLGVAPDGLAFQAPSLAPLVASPDSGSGDEIILLETDQGVNKRAVIVGRYKIVRDENSGETELYDLVEDPDEQSDLSRGSPDLVAELIPVLEQTMAMAGLDPVQTSPVTLSEQQLEQLRSLGYLGP